MVGDAAEVGVAAPVLGGGVAAAAMMSQEPEPERWALQLRYHCETYSVLQRERKECLISEMSQSKVEWSWLQRDRLLKITT